MSSDLWRQGSQADDYDHFSYLLRTAYDRRNCFGAIVSTSVNVHCCVAIHTLFVSLLSLVEDELCVLTRTIHALSLDRG